MNTKLQAICDSRGRPIDLFLTAGPISDYIGARALVSGLPNVKWLLGDRGYDADWFREALQDKKIRPCIPGRKKRKTLVRYDKCRYKRRNRSSRDIACRNALPGSDRDHVRQAQGLAEGCDPL